MLCSGIVSKALKQLGMRPWMMQTLSMSAIGLCIGLWIQAKTYDQDERANAERRARWGSDDVGEGFIRFNAGIEDTPDHVADVERALELSRP